MGKQSSRIIAILAGGRSRRMGSQDKATFVLNGMRLIDRVITQINDSAIAGQANLEVILSAAGSYDTNLEFIPDSNIPIEGPVAGIWSIARWVSKNRPEVEGFVTLPVDAPAFPKDLISRLFEDNITTTARSPSGYQATFSYWNVVTVVQVIEKMSHKSSIALNKLIDMCDANFVTYDADEAFSNINSFAEAIDFERKFES